MKQHIGGENQARSRLCGHSHATTTFMSSMCRVESFPGCWSARHAVNASSIGRKPRHRLQISGRLGVGADQTLSGNEGR